MSYYHTIVCTDCKGPALAHPRAKNTKYCSTCRLLRGALGWANGKTHPCLLCDKPMVRWMNGGEQRCGTCFITLYPKGGRESVEGTCRVCKEPAVVYSKDVAVCFPCLYNPTNFDHLKLAFQRLQVARLTRQ